MSAYWKVVWGLFGILVMTNLAYLQRVPGLMGDEASEGENVYQLFQAESFVIQGERSYIGPLIDYIRVPFVWVLGYTPLALRLVVVMASLGSFWLAAAVLRRLLGELPALFGLVFLFFSPIYLTQQRIGWAVTLIPFFGLLVLFFVTSRLKQRALLAGLVAGVGLSNHILFLPTLIAITVAGIPLGVKRLLSWWPSLVGFVAGFGMQFTVLVLQREDQGDVGATTKLFSQRLADLPDVLPLVVSGSSYVARYTGVELAPGVIGIITIVISVLVVVALVMRQTRKFAWVWALGIVIQLIVLMYMVDRYSLRYFVTPVLGIWALAGVGLGGLLSVLASRLTKFRRPTRAPGRSEFVSLRSLGIIFTALVLVAWSALSVLLPFLRTGGSTNEFSLGNRTDTAAALVDTRPLVACVRGKGAVSSENVHIWNRLQFFSHQYDDLHVLPQEKARQAQLVVEYRDENNPESGALCPELASFRVFKP